LLDLCLRFNVEFATEVRGFMKTVLRFFMGSLAGVTAFASLALADNHEGVAHKVSGHFRTRLEWMDNMTSGSTATKTNYTEQWLNRARLNVDVMPTDTLSGRIGMQAAHTWNQGTTPGFALREGWMAWMPMDTLTIYAGRQELSLGSERFLGDRDWSQAGQDFDALRATFTHDMGTSHFLYSKIAERDATTNGASDGNFLLTYNSFNLADSVEVMRGLDAYAFYWLDNDSNGVAASKTSTFGLGLRANGGMNMIDWELEGILHTGKIAGAKLTGYNIDFNVGANFMDAHRVGVVFTYANEDYSNLFGEIHRYLGQADVVSRNNVLAFGLEGDFNFSDQFYAGLDGYYFMKAKKGAAHNTLQGQAADGNNTALGMEADLRLGYNPEEMVNFELGYAAFLPRKALKDATTTAKQTVHNLYLQGTLKF